jgi:hypothetical protein
MTTLIPSARASRIARWAFAVAVCVCVTAAAAAAPSENAPKSAVAYDSPEEFGKALARAVNDHDRNLMAKFFDVHAFALRIGRAASEDARSQERRRSRRWPNCCTATIETRTSTIQLDPDVSLGVRGWPLGKEGSVRAMLRGRWVATK